MSDKNIRVAINGFGRIGRCFFRDAWQREEVEIVAINDLGDIDNLAYLLQYDTANGKFPHDVSCRKEGDSGEGYITVGGTDIQFLSKKDPSELPWGDIDVDVVVESTGVFRHYEDAKKHLDAGAKRVVLSAPAKGDPVPDVSSATVLMGVNDDVLESTQMTSNASCTTNASSPLVQILHEKLGIEKAMLNTVHGYTASQSLVDSPHPGDFRRGRAAAQNIVPTTTGAAKAVTEAVTDLEEKFDGIAVRVPVVTGSVADITFLASRDTSVEEVNDIFREAATDDRWKEIFTTTEDPIVSSDIIGSPYAAIADLDFTRVVDGNLVKVLSWYDNESGYSHALTEHVIKLGRYA